MTVGGALSSDVSVVVSRVRRIAGKARRRLRRQWRARFSGGRAGPPQRIYSVAFGKGGEDYLSDLLGALSAAGLGYMTGGGQRATARTLHIAADDVEHFLDVAAACATGRDVLLRVRGKWRAPIGPESIRRLRATSAGFELLVAEARIEREIMTHAEEVVDGRSRFTSGTERRVHLPCSRIEVAVWRTVPAPGDDEMIEPYQPLPAVSRVRRATFDRLIADHHDLDSDRPVPAEPTFDVDIVYTWVDDEDPDWRAAKDEWARRLGLAVHPRAYDAERFRNRDELRYSLRSIEQFAPWVRKIFIVTADQCPAWLNLDHPKVELVSHRDIFADERWLPTFNSSAIETQLHHIRGLSEHFIYFNDDVFLGNLTDKGDFFLSNGTLKCFPSTQRVLESDVDHGREEYLQADRNAIELIGRHYEAVGREVMAHVPHPSSRVLLEEMEALFAEEFATAAAQRFRSPKDLRPIAFMQYHFGHHRRMVVQSRITLRYLALWKPTICAQLDGVERRRSYKTFCINDVGLQPERSEQINRAVVDFLEAYFPTPSQFEL